MKGDLITEIILLLMPLPVLPLMWLMTELLLWKLRATTRLRQTVGVRLWTLGVAVQKVGSFTLSGSFSLNEMSGH
jgi:hypothetical protein